MVVKKLQEKPSLEAKLKYFLSRDKKKFSSQKKISKSFKNFLKNFKTFKRFLKFLEQASITDRTIKDFCLSVNRDIDKNGSYNKFLRFCNYTTSENRILLFVIYYHWFGHKAKQVSCFSTIKGIEAAAEKSPRRRKIDKKAGKLYEPFKRRIQMSVVNAFIKFNGRRLRIGVKSNWINSTTGNQLRKIKLYEKDLKSYKVLETDSKLSYESVGDSGGILADYSFLNSYFHKYTRNAEKSAFAQRLVQQRQIRNKRRRAEKFEAKTSTDYSIIINFLRSNDAIKFSDEMTAEFRSELTELFKILKLKRYDDFQHNILSKDKTDQKIAFSQREEICKKLLNAKLKWKSTKPKLKRA